MHANLAQAIGNTPLIRINSLSDHTGCDIYVWLSFPHGSHSAQVKCEWMNPIGSVKDRIGRGMIETAESQGSPFFILRHFHT
jgi:cysteine synthase A